MLLKTIQDHVRRVHEAGGPRWDAQRGPKLITVSPETEYKLFAEAELGDVMFTTSGEVKLFGVPIRMDPQQTVPFLVQGE